MKTLVLGSLVGLCLLASAGTAPAATITFNAFLSGLGENPPNASPATGFGVVVLDDVAMTIKVDESWTGLTAPATASHIHTAPVGVNGPVTFPFSGVPAATSGAIPEQVFSITLAQITTLEAGGMYMNIHTAVYPGGEIRGQLQQVSAVPVPAAAWTGLSTLAGLAGLRLFRRRR